MSQTHKVAHKVERRIDAILDPAKRRHPLKKRNTLLLFLAMLITVVSIALTLPVPEGIAQDSAPKERESHRSLAQLLREKSADLPEYSIRRDYILEDAKLQAMVAR